MQPLRWLIALPKSLDSIPSTHIKQLPTACNSSSYTCYANTCMYTHKKKQIFSKRNEKELSSPLVTTFTGFEFSLELRPEAFLRKDSFHVGVEKHKTYIQFEEV